MNEAGKTKVSVGSAESGEAGKRVPGWVQVGVTLGVLGLALWGLRWLLQGGDVVWTDTGRSFWVPDPLQGWVETTDRWVWLGLEGLGAVFGVVVGTLAMLLAARKASNPIITKAATVASRLGAVVAMAAPILPVWAFLSGSPPAGAERLLPLHVAAQPAGQGGAAAAPGAVAGPVPGFEVSAGTWEVLGSRANLLAARVAAGGETFDAKFSPLSGEVTLVPDELAKSRARFSVPATSVDTGVPLRNTHAQGYLSAETHKDIALTIESLATVGRGERAEVRAFTSEGRLDFMGGSLRVPVTGTLTVLTEAERKELGVEAAQAILVTASFVLPVLETALDRSNFDTDTIPLTARLVIAPVSPGAKAAAP